MPRKQSDQLTSLGILINDLGTSLSFIIEKTGISRNRLVNLRTQPATGLLFSEAKRLAPVLRLTLDELASRLEDIEGNSGEAKEEQ